MDEGNIIKIYKNEMDSSNHGDQLVSVTLYDFINLLPLKVGHYMFPKTPRHCHKILVQRISLMLLEPFHQNLTLEPMCSAEREMVDLDLLFKFTEVKLGLFDIGLWLNNE